MSYAFDPDNRFGVAEPLYLAEPYPEPPRKKGWALPAWLIIAFIVMLALVQPLIVAAVEPESHEDSVGVSTMQVRGRLIVGAADLDRNPNSDYYREARVLNTGSPEQRLRFVVLAGELAGPDEALVCLDVLNKKLAEHKIELTPTQQRLRDILRRLYTDYDNGRLAAPSLPPADRAFLESEWGWFGNLALAPAKGPDANARSAVIGAARRTFLVMIGALFGFAFVAFAGFVLLIVFIVMACIGALKGGLKCKSLHGGVYAETFAVWMVLFIALQIAAELLAPPDWALLCTGAASMFSLVALGWPVLRGITWEKVRKEVGLTAGRQPLLEPVIGVGTYAMALPMLAVGFLCMLLLMMFLGLLEEAARGFVPAKENFGPDGAPSHPVVELVINGGWWGRLQVLFLACVAAPIVEEIMFRGVLYRHLREASHKLGFVLSVLGSATLTSFVFAAIHPQGWVAIPVLMALAFGFTLAREWRRTLIPAMVAHGLNNGAITILLMASLM